MNDYEVFNYLKSVAKGAVPFSRIADKFNARSAKDKKRLGAVIDLLVKNKAVKKQDGRFTACGEFVEKQKPRKKGGALEKQPYSFAARSKKRPTSKELLVGVFRAKERGFGFLSVEGLKDDLFVPAKFVNGALNGDTVEVRRISAADKGDDVAVTRIISRGKTKLCGSFMRSGHAYFVRPDDRDYLSDVIIPSDKILTAQSGDKVAIEIISHPKNGLPVAEVLEVFGKTLELNAEEESIIVGADAQREFDEATTLEAVNMPKRVSEKEIEGRLDLRNDLIFTIDGEDSRDFDDAVSLHINESGNYVLGVHIADVSNYVTDGSALDCTAFLRATSIYLPDRVIPMLPVELSNGICSLNEGVDRLTLTVIAELDKDANIISAKYYKSVICSKRRLTYTLVQKLIEGDSESVKDNADIYSTVVLMNELREKLKNKRKNNGAVELGVREADIYYVDGKLQVVEHPKNEATELIEQFMVLTNECVAELLTANSAPCVYRVHGAPLPDKVEKLKSVLFAMNIHESLGDGDKPEYFKELIEQTSGLDVSPIVNKLVLRTMQKAIYSEENIGHFGLASSCYCHFTSPIRRYPDLAVHRILKQLIEANNSKLSLMFKEDFEPNIEQIKPIIALYADFSKKAAKQSTDKEQIAEQMERDVDELYKTYFMLDKIGEEYEGIISGVTSFGIFVELENTVEGLIKLDTLPEGYYEYDENTLTLKSNKLAFRFGEKLKIQVVSADIASRNVEFIFIDKIN